MQPVKLIRRQILWGTGALVLMTVIALAAALLYVSPLGWKIVTFYTDDALSIRPGDDVRIAGVTVGKVQDRTLVSNQVRVRLGIKDYAFVGDRSQVEVRMLTVVGGYYVNLVSLGDAPLGAKPIPAERATMPYSLMRTLVDTTKVTEEVNPRPFKESLDQLQKGLTGTNIESLSAIVDAGNTVMSTIDKQRGQITAILNLSDEWIRTLSDFDDELKQIVKKVAILEQALSLYSKGFGEALDGMSKVFDALAPVFLFYRNHRDESLERIRRFIVKARMWADRNGAIIRTLRLVRNKVERVLDAQNAPPELLATDMCFPMPGDPC